MEVVGTLVIGLMLAIGVAAYFIAFSAKEDADKENGFDEYNDFDSDDED